MADEFGSGGPLPSPESNIFVDFLTELLHGSPYPSLGPNDPPEWRRERARDQLKDWLYRTIYGKSSGEVQPVDILAALLSAVPVGRFAPAARGGADSFRAVASAGRARNIRGLASSLVEAWVNPIPLPTHAPGISGGHVLYGRYPARRVPAMAGLLEDLLNAATAMATAPGSSPGSVNPTVMP